MKQPHPKKSYPIISSEAHDVECIKSARELGELRWCIPWYLMIVRNEPQQAPCRPHKRRARLPSDVLRIECGDISPRSCGAMWLECILVTNDLRVLEQPAPEVNTQIHTARKMSQRGYKATQCWLLREFQREGTGVTCAHTRTWLSFGCPPFDGGYFGG